MGNKGAEIRKIVDKVIKQYLPIRNKSENWNIRLKNSLRSYREDKLVNNIYKTNEEK